MSMSEWMDNSIPAIVKALSGDIGCFGAVSKDKGLNLAGQKAVHAIVEDMMSVLFPGCHGLEPMTEQRMRVF